MFFNVSVLMVSLLFVFLGCITSEKTLEVQQVEEDVGSVDDVASLRNSDDKTEIVINETGALESNTAPEVLKSYKGRASWYGARHHGKKTASGELFDKEELTAAHRTLPFGTKVQVTNNQNGKSVIVRINDRGPFRKGLIIDLSYAAARAIGMVRAGISEVELEILSH